MCFSDNGAKSVEPTTETKGLTLPVQGILEYWKTLPFEQDLPFKSALDPLSIPTEILPHVFLVELGSNPFSALIRLQGTYLNHALGQHFTGQYIDETTFGAGAVEILDHYEQTVKRRTPYVSQEEVTFRKDESVIVEAIHLPLIDNLGEVKYILGAISRLSGIVNSKNDFIPSHWELNNIKRVTLPCS